ncbi:extracellular solute-binding protein [Murimonas intestini]|uniref:Carbohydrate ABC transporter substrate-binding protein (CUT1 family) n=1 Tax=Murimonas intestini TaxID=1337051 RepID=A0AB73T443_9FIRM|nr:extracellular solute-binding protein [Murimonas intestini]MCR1841632.1 extracellular solute-binding protein [Murimonas intestini]MCR1868518.1 extracellular solute-binding protein [Murimonas intestini]MCR1886119.1 extracellular solute-binding protein [Murimonas intestini]
MKKGIIAAVCCMVLLLGACSGKTAEEDSSTAGNEEAALSILVMRTEETKEGIWQGWGAKKLYDDLQIKLNFFPTGVKSGTTLSHYLIAGQLPDIMGLKGTDYAQLVMDADMLLPLDEYEDRLPNIFQNEAYADAVRYSRDHTSGGTGHLFIMPVAIGPADFHSFNWVPLLQWDAYKQAGMPEINTLEDYLDVAEQMTAIKPVTEKGEKVYGFSLFNEWDIVSALEISTLSYMYGIDSNFVSPLMETSMITRETKSLLAEDSFYKRALRFYFEANQRGLLDPDSMSQKYQDVEDKFSSGQVMFSWFSWLYGSYNSENQNNPDGADGMASVAAKDMKLFKAPEQTIGRQWYFSISKNCKDIDAALEFLNWLYDPAVQQYLTNGPQGITWDYNEKKEPEIINWELVDDSDKPLMPESIGGGAFKDGVEFLGTLGMEAATVMEDGYSLSYRYWPSTLERDPSLMKQEVMEMLGCDTLAEYLYKNHMVAESTQAINMVPTADHELELIINDIGEVVKKYSWKMVYAKEEAEFERMWDEMTDQAEELGIDQVTEYYTREWEKALRLVEEYE